jgi:glycolate oxidase
MTTQTLLINKFIVGARKFLKQDQILVSDIELRLYDTDATSLFKQRPGAIVLPDNAEQVAQVIKLINEINFAQCGALELDFRRGICERGTGVYPSVNEDPGQTNKAPNKALSQTQASHLSFTARGAGTGLSGGAISSGKQNIVIATARLNKLINIDFENQAALVESGYVNETLSEACKSGELYFAPDPSSQKSCTIGGNVAENAGGIHCYKYGVTSDHVLGLEVVLPSGEIIYLGGLTRDADGNYTQSQSSIPGINFARLLVGSEGTFGIVTKALVKLEKIPETFLTMQICFGTLLEASKLTAAIIREGFNPAAIELIDRVALEAVDKAYKLGFDKNISAILLVELDGDQEEVLPEGARLRKLINTEFEPIKLSETQDLDEKNRLWKVRKGVVAAFGQIAPYWYLYDAVVPRSKIPEALEAITAIAKKYNLLLANIAHAADGNLHPNFLYDPDKDPEVIERIFKASHEIMKLCIDLGGVLSGEHGIGIEKREYMDYLFSEADMDTMIKIRKIFDPDLISNPDKIFPLRICKEN